ncbi:MAG: integrin alpha [Limisphaerales bacterium]
MQFQYFNDARGLRQDFLVRQRPSRGPLTLDIDVTAEGVTMTSDADGVRFHEAFTGQPVLSYGTVKAVDATGTTLPSQVVITEAHRLSIVVDDRQAVYPVTVDPDCATISWPGSTLLANWNEVYYAYGEQANEQFGFSVAFADVLNDSYESYGAVIVGAPYFDNGSLTDAGKVYVFYARQTGFERSPDDPNFGPTPPGWTAVGDQSGALFGYSVAGSDLRRNVGRDGLAYQSSFFGNSRYDIVIVGAPGYNSSKGAVFVWKGSSTGLAAGNGANGNLTPDWTITGDQAGAELGLSVASAGDFNDDGVQDVVVGEPYYSFGSSNPEMGVAGVYYGNAGGRPSTNMAWGFYGTQNYGHFGWSVASAGNVNGDFDSSSHLPINDLIIGAPNEQTASGLAQGGQAYVFLGASGGGSQTPQVVLGGDTTSAHFGWSVASFGHVNSGDTVDAVIIGEPDYGNPSSGYAPGAACVYFADPGGAGIVGSSRWLVEGDQDGEKVGYSVCAGDLNSDGANEAIIGAPHYSCIGTCPTGNGAVFIWQGPLSAGGPYLPSSANAAIGGNNGTIGNAYLGYSVAYLRELGYWNTIHHGFVMGMREATECTYGNRVGYAFIMWSP